jgi:AraC-like DNA-binding protein
LDLRIQAAIEAIHKGISNGLEIETLARETNISPSHLRHVFKAEIGLSLTQYIKIARMQQADHLLRTTFLSVKEVMHRVGFTNESYFSREFRRLHSLAPGKYRAKTREVFGQSRRSRHGLDQRTVASGMQSRPQGTGGYRAEGAAADGDAYGGPNK